MKIMKMSIGLILVTVLSILLGFVRESVVVYKLGAGWQADSFTFVIMLPAFLFSSIGGVISTTFLPIYTEIRINSSIQEANGFASKFMNYIVLICFILVILGEVFTGSIVHILAPGFQGQTYILTVKLVKIILPSLIFLGITYCLIGILESYKDLIVTSSITIPLHLSIIYALIFIYPKYGLKFSVAIVFIGSIVQVLFLLFNIHKWHYKYSFKGKKSNKYIKDALKMIGPMTIGIIALQINIMVDKMVASTLVEGSITFINLASKLNTASYSVLGYLVVIVIFPILSEHKAKNNMNKFTKVLEKGVILSLGIMVPVSIIMIFFSKEIINLLFGYGKFTKTDILYTSQILVCYCYGISFCSIRDILNKAFYSMKDTITPMKNGVAAVIINVLLNLILSKIFKAKGIAIATSLSMIICSLLLIKDINKRLCDFELKKISFNFFKIFISGLILYLSIFFMDNLININFVDLQSKFITILYISLITILGLIIYILCLYFFNVEYIKEIRMTILSKFTKGDMKI